MSENRRSAVVAAWLILTACVAACSTVKQTGRPFVNGDAGAPTTSKGASLPSACSVGESDGGTPIDGEDMRELVEAFTKYSERVNDGLQSLINVCRALVASPPESAQDDDVKAWCSKALDDADEQLGAGRDFTFTPAECLLSESELTRCLDRCDPLARCSPELDFKCVGRRVFDCTGECRASGVGLDCAGKCMSSCHGLCETTSGVACAGRCDGICDEVDAAGQCRGMCKGTCFVTAPGSECPGTCIGQCSGSCVGTPSNPVECMPAACLGTATLSGCKGSKYEITCDISTACTPTCNARIAAEATSRSPRAYLYAPNTKLTSDVDALLPDINRLLEVTQACGESLETGGEMLVTAARVIAREDRSPAATRCAESLADDSRAAAEKAALLTKTASSVIRVMRTPPR